MTLYQDAPTGLAYLEGGVTAEQRWVVPVEDELLSRAEWEATKPVYGEASEGEYLRGLLFGAVGEDKVPVMDNRIGPNFGAAVGEETP